MSRTLLALALTAVAFATGCGGATPTGPTGERIPRLSRTRFLAFGDSITAGEVTTPVGASGGFSKQVIVPSASYPSVLHAQLVSRYTAQASAISVTNQGRGSEFILEGRLRFEQVFTPGSADVVLLMEGVVGLDFVGPDTSTAVMRDMVRRAKDGNARVFVGSMIPSVPGRSRSVNAAALVAYNNVLQIMSTQEGVTFVDLYNPMLSDAATLIGTDGLHPTEAGYRRIADLFFAAIRSTLEEP